MRDCDRYHRDSHPEAFAGGGLTIVGESIESDISLGENAEMTGKIGRATEHDPVGGDSPPAEFSKVESLHEGVHEIQLSKRVVYQKPRPRHCVEKADEAIPAGGSD